MAAAGRGRSLATPARLRPARRVPRAPSTAAKSARHMVGSRAPRSGFPRPPPRPRRCSARSGARSRSLSSRTPSLAVSGNSGVAQAAAHDGDQRDQDQRRHDRPGNEHARLAVAQDVADREQRRRQLEASSAFGSTGTAHASRSGMQEAAARAELDGTRPPPCRGRSMRRCCVPLGGGAAAPRRTRCPRGRAARRARPRSACRRSGIIAESPSTPPRKQSATTCR